MAELDKKIAAGASFSSPRRSIEVAALAKFAGFLKGRQAAIIPTVLLLKSVGMARYINGTWRPKFRRSSSTGFRRRRTGCGNACRSPRKSSPP